MFKGGMAGMMQKAKQMQEDMEAVQKEIKALRCCLLYTSPSQRD